MNLEKLHIHWGACTHKGVTYKSYSLARTVNKNGKSRKEIVCKLGKLSDQELLQWRRVLDYVRKPSAKVTDLEDLAILSNKPYLNIAVIHEIWRAWGLDKVFNIDKRKRDIPLSAIAEALTVNRCIDPKSKSRVSTWLERTTLPLMLGIPSSKINPSRIFRELSNIEDCKDHLTKHLHRTMTEKYPEAMKSLFYDLSTTTFEGNKCILVNWGHCKEGYLDHIVLALVVNTLGLPLHWEVLEGNTSDVSTISGLLKNLKKKIPVPIPTMVFDRGMVSNDNLTLLEESGTKYITAMDKNQIEGISGFDFNELITLEENDRKSRFEKDFLEIDKHTRCKEDSIIGDRRYILCYNEQLRNDQQNARARAISCFTEYLEEGNKELQQAKKDRNERATRKRFEAELNAKKLGNFTTLKLEEYWVGKPRKNDIDLAVRTYRVSFEINEEKKLRDARLDGFWMAVTNHQEKEGVNFIKSTEEVVSAYREKVIIEASFRDIKSFVEIAPVHVWREEHVRAHYTICVLSHLIDRLLALSLKENPGKESKDIVSHQRLFEELEGCRLNEVEIPQLGYKTYSLTSPSIVQKDLLSRLGMGYLVGENTVRLLKEEAIKTEPV